VPAFVCLNRAPFSERRPRWFVPRIFRGSSDLTICVCNCELCDSGKPANAKKRGIEIGQVAAILYTDQVVYAVFLDECGDPKLIGEACCATAKLLGVDPDPKTGGTDGPVTYIVFTGASGRITDPKIMRTTPLARHSYSMGPSSH